MPSRCATWKTASQSRTVTGVTVKNISTRQIQIAVNFSYPTSTKSYGTVIYDIYGDGNVVISSTLVPGNAQLPEIPEVGMLCTVPADFSTVSLVWTGSIMKIIGTGKRVQMLEYIQRPLTACLLHTSGRKKQEIAPMFNGCV